jgi:hypothetical protein
MSGLIPYLRRYPGGIIVGLLVVVLMSLIGNVLPLATGIMTDTLAGNPVPFQHSTQTGISPALGLNPSTLSRSIPFYAPSSRRTLGIYCLSSFCASPSKEFFPSRLDGRSSAFPATSNSTSVTTCATSAHPRTRVLRS